MLPIRLLWGAGIPVHERKLLLIIFSAGILTSVVSVAHAVFLLGPSGVLESLTGNIEVRFYSTLFFPEYVISSHF